MINLRKFLPVGLATMAILGAVTLATSADELKTTIGNGLQKMRNGPRVEAQAALAANDYDAWVKAESQNGPLPERLQVITKDNFAKFVSMHQLLKDGKMDEAKVIADELGLKMGMGRGEGFKGQGPKVNEAADTALANGDYNAWVTAVSVNGQLPEGLKVITQANFPKFAEARNYQKQAMELMQKSGDLMKEIGFKPGAGFEGGKGLRSGMKGGFRKAPATQSATPAQ